MLHFINLKERVLITGIYQLLHIQSVSVGIVNILGGGSMDFSE